MPCILSITKPDTISWSLLNQRPNSERLNYVPVSKFRVLCTEDDADTRDLIVLVLSSHNCEVVTSASSLESLHLAQTQHFDLYLLDNWLPGSSGTELCQELRKFDSKTPILFDSGAAYDND